jgi:hypothetical protein
MFIAVFLRQELKKNKGETGVTNRREQTKGKQTRIYTHKMCQRRVFMQYYLWLTIRNDLI